MRQINVLLIEDDDDDAALISHYLGMPGEGGGVFNLKRADRLASGCKLLAQERFDAVLLDLMLPGGVGIEAFLKVREQKPDAAVVVLTGLKDESLALKAVGLGAQDYLVKGTIDDRVLKRALRYAIERARLLGKIQTLLARDADGKLVVDSRNLVRYANAAAETALGRGPRELLDRPFSLEAPAEGRSSVKIHGADGSDRLIEMTAVPIDWEEAPARLVTLRDVTELRRVELMREEVRERMNLIELKNEFMASVSHDLRNPLTTVKTALQSLRDGMVGPMTAPQARFVELAYRNVERQIRIINNVLDLSRLQSGRLKPESKPVALAQALDETSQAYQLLPGAPKLDVQLAADLPDLVTDPDLLGRLLANLLDNAERYARSKVVVRAFASEHEGRPAIEVSVSDDGPGLSEQQLSRLFTRYVQASRAPGTGYKGAGLGLAISKEIVTALGGKIWADSLPGKGARFHFVLPASTEPSSATTSQALKH